LKSPQTTKLGSIMDLMLKSPQADLACCLQHLQVLYLFASFFLSLPWSHTIIQSTKFEILKAFILAVVI
jgi:hypothetical protein